MKRAGNLFAAIAEFDNLRQAFLKARRGKQERPAVREFAADLDRNITRLHRGLLGFEPLDIGNYRYFMVYDPKPRMICAAAFPERVLHHAIMNVCEPVFERYAIFDSYACRLGKGGDRALKRAQYFCRRYGWYLKIDMRKYFDSINHAIMQKLLARRFREKKLLGLFADLLASYETRPGRGLPIGNLISQHLANFYLGYFDHWLKEDVRLKGYLRYMDDCLLFADDKAILKGYLARLTNFLDHDLGLRLKDNTQLNRTICGIPFLGYRVYGERMRLSAVSRRRFLNKLKLYEKLFSQGVWNALTLQRHVEPLLVYVARAETIGLRRKVLTNSALYETF